jgi:hypothetical protein
MRNKFILLLAACLFGHATFAGLLEDARAIQGDPAAAADLYQKHLQTAQPTAAVYFELGQAQMKSGNTALAALSFRRSLILDPRFVEARAALREANAQLGIGAEPASWRTLFLEKMPMDPLLIFGVLCFWLGAFLILNPSSKWRTFLAISFLFIGISACVAVGLCDPRLTLKNQVFIESQSGRVVFQSPVESSEKITNLPSGSVANVLSERGRWFFIELPSGAKGWILNDGVESVIPRTF